MGKLWYNLTTKYYWTRKINEPLRMYNSVVESQMRESLHKKVPSA